MIILGLNMFHGDSSAAIIREGKIVCAVEEERFNRIKHYSGFPKESIKCCLQIAKIKLDQIDYVAVSGDKLAYKYDKLLYSLKSGPKYIGRLLKKVVFYRKVRQVRKLFSDGLRISLSSSTKIKYLDHHLSHAAGSFYPSPFSESAVLTLDGFGDFCSSMQALGSNNDISKFSVIKYPNSLGIVYAAVTQWLGFPYYGDEYKVMGLAPFGQPKYKSKIRKLIRTFNGAYKLNLDYFVLDEEDELMSWDGVAPFVKTLFSVKFVKLFGQSRDQKEAISVYHQDVAASLQAVTEEITFKLLDSLYAKTKSENLCFSGGVAANSVLAGKILQNTKFKKVYIPPSPSDGGNSAGAALALYYQLSPQAERYTLQSADLGPAFSDKEIEVQLNNSKLKYHKMSEPKLINFVANSIAQGKIVGWFQGRMEFGSRALGYRSLLADPRNPKMKNIFNSKVKHREKFRPFAPSVLDDKVGEYFESYQDSPFMSFVEKIVRNKRQTIPAVTHTDGSGRLQTVRAKDNPKFYGLINQFYKKTGVPMLLNTSFNDNEPIVCTPKDAINCFLNTKIDLLAIGNYIIQKKK